MAKIARSLSEFAKVYADREMELAAAHVGQVRHVVQTPSVVQSHRPEHGQEQAQAEARRSVYFEGVELVEVVPRGAGRHEGQGVDGGRGVQREREAQFGGVFAHDEVARGGRQREVVIAAETDDLAPIELEAGQRHPAQVEALEGRVAQRVVVAAQEAESRAGHQHQVVAGLAVGEFVEPLGGELPLVELHHVVSLGRWQFRPILLRAHYRPRWRGFHREGDVRSGAGEKGLIHRIAGERQGVGKHVAAAGGVAEEDLPAAATEVAQVVVLVTHGLAKNEVIIRPGKALAKSNGCTRDQERLAQWVRYAIAIHAAVARFAVGLHRVVHRGAQGIGLTTAQPGLHKAHVVALEVAAVGLRTQVEGSIPSAPATQDIVLQGRGPVIAA